MLKLPSAPSLSSASSMPTFQRKAVRKKKKPIPAPVHGSNIKSHDYDPETQHLSITFRDGRQYCYEGVDPKTASSFSDAPSQGSFLHTHIIDRFKTIKI